MVYDFDDKWWRHDLYCVEWYIPQTKFTPYYVMEQRVFRTIEERTDFLKNRKKKFWEIFPFIRQKIWVY